MSRGTSATPLGKVRGLGPAGGVGHHWLEEKFISVATLLLSLWLIFSLILLPDLSRSTVAEWLGEPGGAVPMALFVVAAFRHGLDGLKVAVDDYVDDEGTRIAIHYLLAMLAIGGAALALFAIARIAFGAAA